jgi:hypothetical protein
LTGDSKIDMDDFPRIGSRLDADRFDLQSDTAEWLRTGILKAQQAVQQYRIWSATMTRQLLAGGALECWFGGDHRRSGRSVYRPRRGIGQLIGNAREYTFILIVIGMKFSRKMAKTSYFIKNRNYRILCYYVCALE